MITEKSNFIDVDLKKNRSIYSCAAAKLRSAFILSNRSTVPQQLPWKLNCVVVVIAEKNRSMRFTGISSHCDGPSVTPEPCCSAMVPPSFKALNTTSEVQTGSSPVDCWQITFVYVVSITDTFIDKKILVL